MPTYPVSRANLLQMLARWRMANQLRNQGSTGASSSAAGTPSTFLGSRPSGTMPPPSPMAATGLSDNLPGVAGGPPAFGSAPGTPPALTLPPWQGGQAGTGTAVAGQGGLPPANLVGTTPSGSIPPPSPMAATGLSDNLPGVAGGPPAFGSAPSTPPPVSLPALNGKGYL
jgi:hypothetical protein